MSRPAIFEMSADARFLTQALRAASVGDVVTYETLGALIGKEVCGATGALRTAMKAALRDDGAVFACVYRVGVKRLSDAEIIALGESETSGTRRRVKRTARKLTAIADYGALQPNQQIRHTALLSVNALIADLTQEKTIAKILKSSGGKATELPIRVTLEAMGIIQ